MTYFPRSWIYFIFSAPSTGFTPSQKIDTIYWAIHKWRGEGPRGGGGGVSSQDMANIDGQDGNGAIPSNKPKVSRCIVSMWSLFGEVRVR